MEKLNIHVKHTKAEKWDTKNCIIIKVNIIY